MSISIYMERDYVNNKLFWAAKNKPNQSQFGDLRSEIYAIGIRSVKL
jgi:hypothetical protein